MHVSRPRKHRPYRHVDSYRWLRSDGTPNFNDSIHRAERELQLLARRNPRMVSPSTVVMRALEEMASHGRGLIVSSSDRRLEGLLTLGDVISYLGGGEYYRIIESRHGYSLYSALEKEVVETIMVRNPVYLYVDNTLTEVLESMITHGIGIIPILNKDGTVYGILTEHDLVKYLYGVTSTGLKTGEVMSKPVVTASADDTLKATLEKMVAYGFRRLPVVHEDRVAGIVTAVDVVRYFGSHQALRDSTSGDIREIHSKRIRDLMRSDLVAVKPDDDLAEAVREMLDKNVSSVLVVDEDGVLQGIVTERDVLYALVIAR
ncbi:MAG: CBS domain-containing protein [Desulfurococcus sp.]|nr:CBS domain-containing protein [Desulfurococcus sp.]